MIANITNPLKLDKQDLKILNALTRDGRITWSELAEEIGLSLTPTLRRVRRLEQDGIIRGYTADLDQAKLIGAMGLFITITMERQVEEILAKFETAVAELPEVISGYLISGGQDYMLHAFVRDLDHYRELLAVLTRIDGIAHIQSSFILKTFARQNQLKS